MCFSVTVHSWMIHKFVNVFVTRATITGTARLSRVDDELPARGGGEGEEGTTDCHRQSGTPGQPAG